MQAQNERHICNSLEIHRWIHICWEPSLGVFKSRLSQCTPLRKMPDREVSWSRPPQSSQAFQSLSIQPSQSTLAVFPLLKTAFLIYVILPCDERTPEVPGQWPQPTLGTGHKASATVRSFAFQADGQGQVSPLLPQANGHLQQQNDHAKYHFQFVSPPNKRINYHS